MKILMAGALAAPLLCLGPASGAFAAMGAPAYPQGLDDPPPVHVVRGVNPGRHYGWTKGKHRGPVHHRPAPPRGPRP